MMIFSWADMQAWFPSHIAAMIDGSLLVLFAAYPCYIWIYSPLIQSIIEHHRETYMLAEALAGAGDSVIITDPHGKIIYVNKAFTAVTGYSREEAIGQNPNMLSSGKQESAFYQWMWNSLNNKGVWQGELWNRRKNGELYPEALNIRAISNDNGNSLFYVGVFSDLTEKKKIEKALLQTQKMEALGTLVGGVAHNFNNLLAAISGKAYLAERSKKESKTLAYIREIQELSSESSELIKQLLTFSRKNDHNKQHVYFIPLLKDAIRTARIGIPENVSIKVSIPEYKHPDTVFVDPPHIKQALINIINNARDAIEESDRKEIHITAHKINRVSCEYSSSCNSVCQKILQVQIRDSGTGINSTDTDQLFDPFFTTKPPGKGTGLGLSTARSIIGAHGGAVNVKSDLSKGTTFSICLPIDEITAPVQQKDEKIVRAESNQLVLVVDDDQDVRSVTTQLLNEIGYKTIEAGDGNQAFEQFLTYREQIDLLVTDMVMPHMDGITLTTKIRQYRSTLPVVIMTGYDSYGHLNEFIAEHKSIILLNKPYTPADFSQRIAKLLKA